MIDINAILRDGEKLTVEAKSAQGGLPNSIWATYSAFANSYGRLKFQIREHFVSISQKRLTVV